MTTRDKPKPDHTQLFSGQKSQQRWHFLEPVLFLVLSLCSAESLVCSYVTSRALSCQPQVPRHVCVCPGTEGQGLGRPRSSSSCGGAAVPSGMALPLSVGNRHSLALRGQLLSRASGQGSVLSTFSTKFCICHSCDTNYTARFRII